MMGEPLKGCIRFEALKGVATVSVVNGVEVIFLMY